MDTDAQVDQYTERQRQLVAQDLRALGDKLDVKQQARRAVNQKIDSIKEKVPMHSSSNPMVRSITSHPIAALAFVAGGAKLFQSWQQQSQGPGLRARAHDLQDHVSGAAHSVSEHAQSAYDTVRTTAGEKAGEVQAAVSGAAQSVQQTGSQVGSQIAGTATDVGSTVKDVMPTDRQQAAQVAQSYWPLLGAGAFAVGGLIGYLTPNTAVEDQRLGPVREDLMDTAKEKFDQVKDAAEDAAAQAKQAATENIQEMASQAKEVAADITQQAKDTFQEDIDPTSEGEDSSEDSASSSGAASSSTYSASSS